MAEKAPRNIQTVIVGNNREYFSPLDQHVAPELKAEFLRTDVDEADMDMMWHGDNKIVMLPEQIDPAFVRDISTIFQYRNTHIIAPTDRGLGLSENAMRDPGAFNTISRSLKASNSPQIVPWGYTPGYQRLTDRLREDGAKFATPEDPLEAARWTPDYIDTKIGSRELLMRVGQRDKRLKLPEGFVCETAEEVVKVSQYFTDSGRGVVLKANIGGSGMGVNVIRPSEFGRDSNDNKERVRETIRHNPLLQQGPVVLEEYIRPNFRHHGTFPSVDSIIRPNGEVEVQCVDAMVIKHHDNDVTFYGCVLGKGLFNRHQKKQLAEVSKNVGIELSKLGYRGWYDVDYILAESGGIYATEANLRRTSLAYMVDLGHKLIGEDFQDRVAMRSSDKHIRRNLAGATYGDVKEVLDPIMYPMEGKGTGIIITQSFRSMLGRGKFGYVSIGNTQGQAEAIENELDSRLQRV